MRKEWDSPHLSWLISWNKKMSLKKCFSNFLQVLKDQFKSWVSNFFGEGFLRKSSLKIFTKNSKWNLSHNCHSICLFLGPQWFPLRKIFAQDVFGWPWLKKSTWRNYQPAHTGNILCYIGARFEQNQPFEAWWELNQVLFWQYLPLKGSVLDVLISSDGGGTKRQLKPLT